MKKLIASVVAVLALTVACLPADGKPVNAPAPNDTGAQISVMFGDSLCWDDIDELSGLFVADEAWRISLNCFGGTQFETALWKEKYGQVTDPPSQPGAVAFLALGTNDVVLDANIGVTRGQFRDAVIALTDAGASAVVVPTLATTALSPGSRLDRTREWNDWLWLADASPDSPWRALRVVDWEGCSKGHRDWFNVAQGDAIHISAVGQAAYAGFLYDQRVPAPLAC